MPTTLSKTALLKQRRERYAINVMDLLETVSKSSVCKQDKIFEDDDEIIHDIKLIAGEYAVDPESRWVFSVEADDSLTHCFQLNSKDYKCFVAAFNKRRAELIQQRQMQRNKTKGR